jgi:hypothetical protein
MSNLSWIDKMDEFLSMLRHPSSSSDPGKIIRRATIWFNDLDADEKAEVFQYMMGKVNNG